jgi:universal stress protein A
MYMIPKKILVCTDFSENSMPPRQVAIEYAKVFSAELFILHVVNLRFSGYPSLADRVPVEMALVQKHIEEGIVDELQLLGNDSRRDLLEVSTHSRAGDPSEEIIRFAEEKGIDLIVMGTHGWTGVKHMLLGSTAEKVVRSAVCPVLTVRSPS